MRIVRRRHETDLQLLNRCIWRSADMPMFEKHFTVDEARSWLPDLRQKFQRIHSLYAELQELQDDYVKVQAIIRANGHGPKETGFETRAIELQTLVQEIIEAGIQ